MGVLLQELDWLPVLGSERQGQAWIENPEWVLVVSVGRPRVRVSCRGPVSVRLALGWSGVRSAIPVVLVGLHPVPVFFLVLASELRGLVSTDAETLWPALSPPGGPGLLPLLQPETLSDDRGVYGLAELRAHAEDSANPG
ncbi:hypothetical protein VB716_03025 [Synechococcus sp. CCY9201]|uniref:hypothetical protein n=1 Tax=Synechococcus sp. CCY9201 TaxID=174697 RepID=UPI002B20157C|nr:hypothetical protein [Synechococcus sp. CCY9201]MEA5473189.1 hypothetical protein [Synechococcus sp. CCY9201]